MEDKAQRARLDFRADFGDGILHPLIAPKLHHSVREQRPNLAGAAFVNRKISSARKNNRAHLEAIQPAHRTITALSHPHVTARADGHRHGESAALPGRYWIDPPERSSFGVSQPGTIQKECRRQQAQHLSGNSPPAPGF